MSIHEATQRVADCMDQILTNFKDGAKITVLVRYPGKPNADFCLTNDDLDEVIAMVQRRKIQPPPPQPNLSGWQPIETAPKDGTRILIWFGHANARFSKDPVAEGWAAAHEAYWIDHNGGGWTWHGLCGAAMLWQPLPAPPATNLQATDNNDKSEIPQGVREREIPGTPASPCDRRLRPAQTEAPTPSPQANLMGDAE